LLIGDLGASGVMMLLIGDLAGARRGVMMLVIGRLA
jgi:hypothetical protein